MGGSEPGWWEMRNPLLMKLDRGWPLGTDDRARLATIISKPRVVPAREDIVCEGEKPQDVRLIVEGFACRYKLMPNGRRSIMAYLLPGDFCDLNVTMLNRMDHSVTSLTPCSVVDIPHALIHEIMETRPQIARALWWAVLADEAILREWLVNMGQRSAEKQLAHLFCELRLRLSIVGLGRENTFKLPLTQEELGHTLGISTVHVNRVLQHLRSVGLIRLLDKTVLIPDVAKLEEFAEFDPEYLNLGNTRPQIEALLSESA
jgi:CRP-like cAMP-binding protein